MRTEDYLLAAMGFVGVTAVLTFFSRRQQKAAWTGYVEEKVHFRDQDYNEDFYLHIRTDQGKKIELKVFENTFHEFQKGDRVQKDCTDLFPVKMSPTASE